MENSVTSKDVHEEFMPYDNVNDIVDQLFQSLLLRCQGNLETSMRGSDFIFDSVQLLHYKCDKTNFRLTGSYIDCSDWLKNKKSNNK